ncbi:MAG: AAA family ATPase [Kiritimatiellia bacterium]
MRGARQVGKTYSIRELGKTFRHFVEVNFEEAPEIRVFFRDSLNPVRIREKLAAYFSTPIVAGETMLFFDEIQACPEALSALRFFHEKMPALRGVPFHRPAGRHEGTDAEHVPVHGRAEVEKRHPGVAGELYGV